MEMIDLERMKAAGKIVSKIIGISNDVEFLRVTDPLIVKLRIAFALVCFGLGAETVLAIIPVGKERPRTDGAFLSHRPWLPPWRSTAYHSQACGEYMFAVSPHTASASH